MYKLMIVDDEDVVRTGLIEYVKWEKMGFCVVAAVSCAKKALDFIKEQEIHVVLTDIIMPDMTGLELATQLYEQSPNTKVVILSGYPNFEYAKEAMKLGAVDF